MPRELARKSSAQGPAGEQDAETGWPGGLRAPCPPWSGGRGSALLCPLSCSEGKWQTEKTRQWQEEHCAGSNKERQGVAGD